MVLMSVDVIELPEPQDDGAAAQLVGRRLPAIEFPATDGRGVRLDTLPRRSVVFVYPAIGGPGRDDQLAGWTAIPGARGCTPEACSFRDELAQFLEAGIDVYGLSGQDSANQRRHVSELGLRYQLLSDEGFELAEALGVPSFEFDGRRYYRRLTLIVGEGVIEAALYPVFPPQEAASQALRWLSEGSL
jgi:peroxiredoxin